MAKFARRLALPTAMVVAIALRCDGGARVVTVSLGLEAPPS
jgi:hypothetical protein